MKKFEIGKEYFDTSACDHNCVFTIKIVKRTDKTVTFERNGKTRRTKLFSDERGEYIIPYRYSMAPVFRAEREVQPEEPAEESAAAPAAEDAAPSKIVTISQPADDGYGLSLAPAGVRATLERGVKQNAAIRQKVIDATFRLDVSTVPA